LQIAYATDAPAGASAAHWAVTASEGTKVQTLTEGDLRGEPESARPFTVQFESTGRPASRHAFDIIWDGKFTLKLLGMRLSRAPA
jgi:hypothetical protein